MSFGAPGYLAFVALVPVAAAVLFAWTVWRHRAASRFGRTHTGVRAYIVPVLLLCALAFAAFAAARPQYGDRSTRVEDRGIDLVVVLDVSQSMYAADAAPSRIGRAQAELQSLLERLEGDRVGVVIFGGSAFVRSPLTSDVAALSRLIGGVDQERGLVQPGSDLGAAIGRAQTLVTSGDAETKALLIISDGEDHGGRVATEIANARVTGTVIYTAGAGTTAGSPVLDANPDTGELMPRFDTDGAPVLTRLDAAALRRIAETGGGRYIELAGAGRPLTALASELESLDSTTFATSESAEPVERFQLFAGVALALALVSYAVTLPRPRVLAHRVARLWPLAGAGLLLGAICGDDVASLNRRGNDRYNAGDYATAVERYREAQELAPDRPELHYNAGNALNRRGEFGPAVAESKRALTSGDDDLIARVEYAIGNHYAGEQRLTDALEAYKRALLADPSDGDAKHNLEVILQRIEATPTAIPPTVAPPEGTPDPSDSGDPGGEPSAGAGTETPDATSGEGTPSPGGEQSQADPEAVRRALEEALRGIDDEVTVAEALRILDLLEEQNRQELEEPRGGGEPGVPDY